MRLDHLPSRPGADWRDLPNIDVQLKNEKNEKVRIFIYRIVLKTAFRGYKNIQL